MKLSEHGCAASEPVHMLVGNATVITCDPAQPVVRHGAVAVTGDKVVQVGPRRSSVGAGPTRGLRTPAAGS